MVQRKKANYAAANDGGLKQHTGYGSPATNMPPPVSIPVSLPKQPEESMASDIGTSGSRSHDESITQAGATKTKPNVENNTPIDYGGALDGDKKGPYENGDLNPTFPTQSNIGTNESGKYDYLRDAAATELLSAGTQATIAEQIARKNLALDLQRQGLANSGYSATASALISNAGANQRSQAQTAYTEAMRAIEQQELEEADEAIATEADNIGANLSSLAQDERDAYLLGRGLVYNEETGRWENGANTNYTETMLNGINDAYMLSSSQSTAYEQAQYEQDILNYVNSSSDKTSMENYLRNAGFTLTDGKWTYNGEGEISENTLRLINNAYAAAGAISNGYTYEELGDRKAGSNSDKTFAEEYAQEYGRLQKDIEQNNISDGDVLVFVRGDGRGEPYYVRYENGQFVVMSDAEVGAYVGEVKKYTGGGDPTTYTKGANNSSNGSESSEKSESSATADDKPSNSRDALVGTTKNGRNVYQETQYGEIRNNPNQPTYYYYYIDPETGEAVYINENGFDRT